MTDEDQQGVFVPFWILDEAPSPAAAIALAQITWWFQPSRRGTARERFIDRKGERWLAMTDQRLGEVLGVSDDAAHRVKLLLKREGFIDTMVAKVDGVRSSLIRPVYDVLQRRSVTVESRDNRTAESRDNPTRDITVPIRSIEKEKDESKETSANDPVRRMARRLTDDWWEQRQAIGQAPAQPYIAVLKIVTQALRNGVTVQDLTRALADCATVTGASLEFTLSKRRGKVGRPPPNIPPDVAAQIMADYEHAHSSNNGPRKPAGRALPLNP